MPHPPTYVAFARRLPELFVEMARGATDTHLSRCGDLDIVRDRSSGQIRLSAAAARLLANVVVPERSGS